MSAVQANLVASALRDPQALPGWSSAQWEGLLRQARSTNLLSRLAAVTADAGVFPEVPAAPRAHLEAARVLSQAHAEAVRREVTHVQKALAGTGVDIILLKGAAYLYAGLAAARGRVFSDVDILVPHGALAAVEAALMRRGWATTHHDAYDQRYYRRWMHELPPLQHAKRLTVLDVHHAILPPTARLKPDSAKLWAASRPVPGVPPLRLFAPADMVLHSAAHLFFNEEFSHGLRDLTDIDSLLRHFGQQPGFWDGLADRAAKLELTRPLYYALRYATQVLATPVPPQALLAARAGGPPGMLGGLMDSLFRRVLQPDHPSTADAMTPIAQRALYVRAHWLRMPPLLLAYHLTVKALRPEEPQPAAR